MDTQASTVQDDLAKMDVVKSPGSDKMSGDALSTIRDMQTTLARQNDRILSQIKGLSSDIGNMKRDLSKVTKIVCKLDTARDRETYAANILQCEFRTFSRKVVSTLRSLQGIDDQSDCVDDYWNEYFHGEESVLSNFYMSSLHVNGLEFKSAEHMYQYKKAEFHGRERDVGEDILHAPYGAAAKGASRNIEVCLEWEEQKEEIMFDILCLKAEQCKEFADKLHATGCRPLIHDLPVHLWGWGTNGQGLNLMGRILERVRGWLLTGNPSRGTHTRHLGQQKAHNEEGGTTREIQPQEPLRREDRQKNAPASQEEWKQRSPKKKNRNSDWQGGEINKRNLDTTDFSTGKEEDWPGLPQPGTKDSKRHVTSDNKSKSLQVEVMGDSQGQGQDHEEGTEHRHQPHQRQGKGRGLLTDRHGKGSGGRRGGGGYNNNRWNDKGHYYADEQDKSTDSTAHEQVNDTEYHDEAPTHTERQGHTGGGRGSGRRGSSHRKPPREQDRSTESPHPEHTHDPEPHDDRHGHTGGRGNSRRGNSHYEQQDSTSQKQITDPKQHDEKVPRTDERYVEPYRGGRRGNRRGGNNQRGPRHQDSYSGELRGSRHQDSYSSDSRGSRQDSYSGESRGSRHHDYNSGESQGHYYSSGRRKAPHHDYTNRLYSDHQENPGDNSGPGRDERHEASSSLPSDRGSHPTDSGMGAPPPGFVKGQAPVGRGRPITSVTEAGGAERHVTLAQDQCQVTLDCHPTKNSVSG